MAHTAPVSGQIILRDRQIPVTRERGRHGRVGGDKEWKGATSEGMTSLCLCGERISFSTIIKGGEAISGQGANQDQIAFQEHREDCRFYAKLIFEGLFLWRMNRSGAGPG